MRRVLLALISTVTGLVMLLSFKTHAIVTVAPRATIAAPAPTTPAAASATGGTAPAVVATKTVTGDAVDTRWGPVQVQITVASGRITSAVAVAYPDTNGQDQQINAYAVPVLQQETVAAGSASIDMVSGATYTSRGYITSLQSALDRA